MARKKTDEYISPSSPDPGVKYKFGKETELQKKTRLEAEKRAKARKKVKK